MLLLGCPSQPDVTLVFGVSESLTPNQVVIEQDDLADLLFLKYEEDKSNAGDNEEKMMG